MKTIAELNDTFRKTFTGGEVVITRGVDALKDVPREQILRAVRAFDTFEPEDDPHGEHDFGAIQAGGEHVFWKIDYYDHTMRYRSDDPTDPAKTKRVLTIMLASEY